MENTESWNVTVFINRVIYISSKYFNFFHIEKIHGE